jgi:putative membrane protein
MKSIVGVLVTALGIWIAVAIVPGLEFTGNWVLFGAVALILSLVNALVKPILKLLTLPFVMMTFGLFLLVINALMLQLTLWISSPAVLDLGFSSDGFFWSTFLGALVISLVQMVVNIFVDTDGK